MAIVEAALGAVFGELLKAISEIIDKAVTFKRTWVKLQSTLEAIAPLIKEIEQGNNKLERPKEELESLRRKMEEGTKLVSECSKIGKLNHFGKVRYQTKLEEFEHSLMRFFIIELNTYISRDQKETLHSVTRLQSSVNKLLRNTVGASSDSNPGPGEVNDSTKAQSAYEDEVMNVSDTPISTQLAQNSTEHQVEQIKIQDMDSSFIQATEMQNSQIDLTTTSMNPTITVIGPQYCTSFPILLEIVRMGKEFSVVNINDKIICNLKRPSCSIHEQFILFDENKNPIVTLHRKKMTAHNRWQVFKGESDQILFNVKQHHIIQLKTKLDIFLATNTEEKDCDFMVQGSWFGGYYGVYAVQSGNIIAQISKYTASERIWSSKENVVVRVKPNVDFAFIVALIIVILSLK
ncbi:LURP-one-related 15 [Spatholobus suberectus]|nr:LURP-one-related 15 [Spatholobus suberectus]